MIYNKKSERAQLQCALKFIVILCPSINIFINRFYIFQNILNTIQIINTYKFKINKLFVEHMYIIIV